MPTRSVFLVLRRSQAKMQDTDLFSSTGKLVCDTHLFSSVGKAVRGVESFSNVERSLSKGKRNRVLESVQLSQVEKDKILSTEKPS